MTNRLVALVFPIVVASFLHAQARNDSYRPPTIRKVIIEHAWQLPASEKIEIKNKILEEYAEAEFADRSTIDGLAENAAERLRAAYQNKGYFKVEVAATVEPVGNYAVSRSVDIAVTLLSSGTQYRLGAIRFTHATAFSEKDLLAVMPVRSGEIFSRSQIAKGLEALRQCYASAGYINFTSIPDTTFDEGKGTVNLTIDVDEGRQFHWGDLIIIGRDDEHTQAMLDAWWNMRGEVYSPDVLRQFFSKFFHSIPADADPTTYTQRRLNERAASVDVVLKFVEPIFEAQN